MNLKYRVLAIAIACISFWCASPALTSADIAQPENRATPEPERRVRRNDQLVTFVIEASEDYQARLYVPENLLAADATAAPSGMSAVGTTVSGIALSLSVIFGGLWLARSRKRLGTQTTATAAAILVVLAATATYTWANASPYPLANPGTLVQATPTGAPLSGKVRVMRVSDGDDRIRLLLPKER